MLPIALSFATLATAVNTGDQIGSVFGSPTWKFLLVDHAGGLYAMDTSGKAVWSCGNCGEARDMLESGDVVTIEKGTGMVKKNSACKNVEVAESFTADGHEARIDTIDNSRVVGITQQGCADQKIGCQGILHWDMAAGKETMPIDLGKYFDPSKDWGYLSSKDDWMHTNCAGTGIKNNFLVGIRHLSAIVSFDYTSAAKQWVFSSEITSNFTFDKDEDKFYNCHDMHQLPNGNILLYDNGNKRNGAPAVRVSATGRCEDAVAAKCPNTSPADCKKCGMSHASDLKRACYNWPHDMNMACSSHPSPSPSPPSPSPPSPSGEYSRALEYSLDFQTMKATVVYEFRTAASHAKGAARRMSNGHTLVTCPECKHGTTGGVVYEADGSGKEVSRVEMTNDDYGGIYRAQPIDKVPGQQRQVVV